MQKLNFPAADIKYKTENKKSLVLDIIRRKYVVLTPEERVRQYLLHYLVNYLKYPPGLLAVETLVKIHGLNQRADVVAYNKKGEPSLIAECKAPDVKIDNSVFDQAARYNLKLGVAFLLITNGIKHYCAHLDKKQGTYKLLKKIPFYEEL